MKLLYRICLASILILSVSPYLQGQNVGISSTTITPDAQAILELRANDKGVLLPRLTTSEAATLAGSLDANDDGMIIYDTVLKQFKYWDGSTLAWVVVATPTTVAGSTLDDAYDAGGSGTGRTITGDAGAVRIIGTGATIALETDGDIQLSEDDTWIGSSPSLQRIRFDDNSGGRIHMEDADVTIDNGQWFGVDGSNPRITFNSTDNEIDIQDANIEFDAESWIGVGSSIERIEFQGSDNEINIMGATGGVGIGTLAPSNNLHIYDNTNSGIGITIENPNTTSTASSALIFDYAGAEYAGIYSRSENYSGANDYLQIINNHGAGSLIEMVTNGGSRMTIDDAGIVSLPSYSSGSSGLMVASTAGILSKTDFSGNASDVLTGDGNWSDISAIVSNDGDWTVSGNDIYNANSGNIGIGIAVPVTKLDVRGGDIGVQGDRAIVIGGNASAVPDNTPDAQLVLDGAHNTGHNLGGTKLLIRGFDNEANTKAISIVDEDANELFYIQSQATNNGQTYFKGNVGIGNTNPLNGLVVNMAEGVGTGYTGVGISGGASGNPKIELRGGTTPYLDFANDSGTDYDGRIRLTSDDQMAIEGANLGIGITAPLEALHVNGNARISGLSAGGNVQADGSGNLIISNDIPSGDSDYIQNQNTSDQAANFRINGTGVIGPNSGGVGSSRLKISNTATDYADFRFSGSGMGQLEFVGWSSGWNINAMTNGKHLYVNRDAGANSDIYLGRSGLEAFIEGNTGNFGIGTASPLLKLDVRGKAVVGNAFTQTTSTDDNQLNIISGSNATGNQNGISFYENTGGFGMSFGYDGTGFGAGNALRIYSDVEAALVTFQNGGNVGLGETTPTEKLHVVGDARVTGLSGTGERNVYADANGVLQAGPSKKKYDVDVSSSLHPSYDDLSYTNILNSCSDDAIYTVNWGFNFTIDGVNYTEGRLSTNGILFFGNTGSTAYSNTALPTGITNNPALFFHWDDHAGFDFNYAVDGTAGARICHIRWRGDENIGCGGNDMNFYITLHESSNTVSVRYFDIDPSGGGGAFTRGSSATIGFQHAGGASAEHITMGYNAELIDDNSEVQHFSLTFK